MDSEFKYRAFMLVVTAMNWRPLTGSAVPVGPAALEVGSCPA
jgi:hypothetical protein